MSEMEEIKERMRESGAEPPKRKIGKRGKIAVIGTAIVIAILLGAYIAITLNTPPPEKYWKPDREFKLPDIDWKHIQSYYVLKRTTYDQSNISFIANKKVEGSFSVYIICKITDYDYSVSDSDDQWLHPAVYTEKNGSSEYRIKELEFHFSYENDRNVSYWSITWRKMEAKNIYFDVTPGKYSGPYGTYDNKLDSDWMNHYKIVGVNKDRNEIKDCGFSFPMQLSFFDEYPHWTNHTITLTATLYYGKYVNGWLGSGWQDVHELETSIVIYVVSEENA